MTLSAQKLEQLKTTANLLRQDIISMIYKAGSGHPAGSLGMAEIFTALYFYILNQNPKDHNWQCRDRLVLSHGHICPVLYAALARAGCFPVEELKSLRQFGSRLQGHPHRESLPGVETTSGPLGSGLSQAVGMALAGKMDRSSWRAYCLLSDGEHDEGNLWEAVLLASKYKLDNLTALIDRNGIQSDGKTEEILPLESLKLKYEAFGWQALEIDGHDFEAIIEAFDTAKNTFGKPTVIIAHTVPGKGVSFMEGDFMWHAKALNKEEYEKAVEELKK